MLLQTQKVIEEKTKAVYNRYPNEFLLLQFDGDLPVLGQNKGTIGVCVFAVRRLWCRAPLTCWYDERLVGRRGCQVDLPQLQRK